MTGIYGIYNKITGKWYVGQSVDIMERNRRERQYLSQGFFHWGSGDNRHIVAAWKKYGPAAFDWVVLEECTPDELNDREIFWIAEKDSYRNGYNQTLGGGGCRGFRVSEETRRKISENHADVRGAKNPMYGRVPFGVNAPHYGKKHSAAARQKMRENHADISGANNPRARAVAQIDPQTGRVLAAWPYLTDAAQVLGINHRNISAVCLGRRKTAGGYAWAYIERE